jgi:hypothetical protein
MPPAGRPSTADQSPGRALRRVTEQTGRLVHRALTWLERHAGAVFAAMALAAFAGLLYLGRHATFFQDEWSWISIPGAGSLQDWLSPHNEHWSTVPFGIYRVLLLMFGLKSYLPFLAAVIGLHVLASAAMFSLARRAAGGLVGLAIGVVFLLLGSGWQNLFWAFQIGFVGSVAFGLWAIDALDRGRAALAFGLLVLSLASSGIGLVFLGVALVDCMVGRRWRALVAVTVAIAVFLVWFTVLGRNGIVGSEGAETLPSPGVFLRFVVGGIPAGVGAVFGAHGRFGWLLLAALLVGSLVLLARGRLPFRAVSFLAGLVGLYVLLGIGRAAFGDGWAVKPRYVYVAAALLFGASASIVGGLLDRRPGQRPDESVALTGGREVGPVEPAPRGALGALVPVLVAVLTAFALVGNLAALRYGARWVAEQAGETRAGVGLLDLFTDGVGYTPPPGFIGFPPPEQLAEAVAMWGAPTTDMLLPSVVRPSTPREQDQALWRWVGGGIRPSSTNAPSGVPPAPALLGAHPPVMAPTSLQPPRLVSAGGATASTAGSCVILHAAGDPSAAMSSVVEVPDGGSIAVIADGGGSGYLQLGWQTMPDVHDQLAVEYPDGSWVAIAVPELGSTAPFKLRLGFPTETRAAAVCAR